MSSPTLILLYSEESTYCKKLRSIIKDEYLNLFETVCIDSEEIREAIVSSENIKINDVPCFLHIFPDGTVAKYEATKAFEFIAQYISSMNRSKTAPTISGSQPSGGLPVSSIDKLMAGLRSLPGSDPRTQAPALAGAQARKPTEVHIPRGPMDVAPPRRGPRRQPFQGITSERDISGEEAPERPVQGEGHEDMVSSLSGMGRSREPFEAAMMEDPREAPRTISVGRGAHATVIQDLTPEDEDEERGEDRGAGGGADHSLDEDPSGMSIPRGDVPIRGKPIQPPEPQEPGQMGGRGKGTSSVKAMARAIASARENEIKSEEEARRGPVQAKRAQGKKGIVKLA